MITVVVAIYLTTQFLTIGSTSNIGIILQEVAQKQKTIFEFLINQSIESATRLSTYDDIVNVSKDYKEDVLKLLAFNKNIKIYDVIFFDLEGNLINESYEGFTSFNGVFGDIRIETIIEPTVVNIRYSKTYADNVMDILIPVFEDGKMIAIMWQVESFERINSAMKNVSILETGESYIIDESGKVLTDLKFSTNKNDAITLKESKIVDSTIDKFETVPYLDYKNESVYGYHTNLALNRWKLIVEVSENEVVNTSANINGFLVKAVTLILAVSKLLDPILNNRKDKKQDNGTYINLDEDKDLRSYDDNEKKIFYKVRAVFEKILNSYKKYKHYFNMSILIITIVFLVTSISTLKTDSDIQSNLNSSNQVNRRIVSYYVNEIKSQIYLMNRMLSEYDNLELEYNIKRNKTTNNNILNIVLLDENYQEIYNTINKKIDETQTINAITNNLTAYNSIGISDIFYDINYGQHVFYLSGRILEHESDKWMEAICVVSVDNLINMLNNNEVYSSRIISILDNKKIMYSNIYRQEQLPNEQYEYLKLRLDKQNTYNNNIFNVNKYKNIEGVEVFGNYTNINNKEVMVYGSYTAINDTKWQLLYEEPVAIAKSRVVQGSINLLIQVLYQYMQNMVNTLS